MTGSYWYGRAWVLTGNPTYPLLSSVFEPRIWYPREPRLNLSLFGMGTTLLNLLLLPWRLTRFPHRFVEEGDIGIAYLTLLPVMITGIARRQVSRPLLATLVVTILAWFFTAQYLRYLLPLLPLMALTGTGSLLESDQRVGKVVLNGDQDGRIHLAFFQQTQRRFEWPAA